MTMANSTIVAPSLRRPNLCASRANPRPLRREAGRSFRIRLLMTEAALAAFYNKIGVLAENVNLFTKLGIAITGIYLFCIGAVMQVFPKLGARED